MSGTRQRAPARVLLAHGGGGELMDELLERVVRPPLANVWLDTLGDSAVLPSAGEHFAFSTDSYVVQPLEFPGGDIGRLAVSGTVNDLAVCGAVPRYLSLGLILEEGLEIALLERVMASVAETAREAGVSVVTGDCKVVARGQADGMYLNTSGIGALRADADLGMDRVRPGDHVLASGPVGGHGLAVMLQREEAFGFESELRSDVAPLSGLIGRVLDACGEDVAFMRDPTRGGLAGVVTDIAFRSGWRLTLDEACIPVRQEERYAADMLGLDPLDVASEGKVVIVVRAEASERALEALRAHPLGREAARIGVVEDDRDGLCDMITEAGGRRVLQKPYGEELPRIC